MSVSIEVGHIYAPDRALQLKEIAETGFEFEKQDRRIQALNSIVGKFATEDCVVVCFIDDVAARAQQKESPDPARWQSFINASTASVKEAFGPDEIKFESEMVPGARELVYSIRQKAAKNELLSGYRLSLSGSKLIAGSGRGRTVIPLTGFKGIEDPQFPSCQMLDLAWVRSRLDKHDELVTILHDDYRQQQAQVEMLAGIFPDMQDARITTVFVDDHGADMGWRVWFDQ